MILLWKIRLEVDSPNAKSLASSLVSEENVSILENTFSIELNESRAKDARAMWNTRMRSVVVSHRILKVMEA